MLTGTELATLSDQIQELDFYTVFRISDQVDAEMFGTPTDAVVTMRGVSAPTVHHSETDDVEIDGTGWQAMTGLTGQDRYRGAVMHPSEQMSPWVVDHMVEITKRYESVMFAMVVVDVWPDDEDDDPEPAGWAIVYRTS